MFKHLEFFFSFIKRDDRISEIFFLHKSKHLKLLQGPQFYFLNSDWTTNLKVGGILKKKVVQVPKHCIES